MSYRTRTIIKDEVLCHMCGASWWHVTGREGKYLYCGVIRQLRAFVIPGDASSWSLDQQLWMTVSKKRPIVDEARQLIERGADVNYLYRGRSMVDSAIAHADEHSIDIVCFLLEHGTRVGIDTAAEYHHSGGATSLPYDSCGDPIMTINVRHEWRQRYYRSIIARGLILSPRIAASMLRVPNDAWYAPENTTNNAMFVRDVSPWRFIIAPRLAVVPATTDTPPAAVIVNPDITTTAATTTTTLVSNNSDTNGDDDESDQFRPMDVTADTDDTKRSSSSSSSPSSSTIISGVHRAGMGVTCGVSHLTPYIDRQIIELAASGQDHQRAMLILPWLIWACGTDLSRISMLPPPHHYNTNSMYATTNSRYTLNQLVEIRDADGFSSICTFDASTGDTNHQQLRVHDRCEWIPARVIDIGHSMISDKCCVRLTLVGLATSYDDWINEDDERIRIPTADKLTTIQSIRPQMHANEDVLTWLRREKPIVLPYIDEAINAVKHARMIVRMACSLVTQLPDVLHTVIASYAI